MSLQIQAHSNPEITDGFDSSLDSELNYLERRVDQHRAAYEAAQASTLTSLNQAREERDAALKRVAEVEAAHERTVEQSDQTIKKWKITTVIVGIGFFFAGAVAMALAKNSSGSDDSDTE